MSAIYGIWNIGGGPVSEGHLDEMRDMLAGYGHDAQAIFVESNIGFGCHLLKSGACSGADSPVHADGSGETVLVCDALIWNRAELVNELHLNNDASTQTVVLQAYKEWGEECPKHMNGDFVLAVWDKKKNQLFIARDHLGVRPLYYFFDGSIFAFATDCKALLCLPFVEKQLNEFRLYADLNHIYHIDPEATFFTHVNRLPQAHALCVSKGGLRKCKYWTPGVGGRITYETEENCARSLYRIVEDAIRIRVHGVSKNIGAELSGGLDSSVIAILANRELKEEGGKLEALFSWSPTFALAERKPGDERDLVEAVCFQEQLCCNYHDHRNLTASFPVPALPPEVGYGREVLHSELMTMSGRGVKWVLSGWGGDHGISHPTGLYELFMAGHVGYFLKQAWWLSRGSFPRFMRIIMTSTVLQWFRPYGCFGNPQRGIPDILSDTFREKMKSMCRKNILYSVVDPVKHLESGALQERTELSSQLDARYGIQHLYPFLDHRVVDFAISVPKTMNYKHGKSRCVFRNAFKEILPEQFNSYFTKDDAVKTAYYRKRAMDDPDRMKNAADEIDRDLFAPYIDWKKLQNAVQLSRPNDNSGRYPVLKMKIQTCLDIQQTLQDIGVLTGSG